MKKIAVLLVLNCFVTGLFAQSCNTERNKIKNDIEKLNKEMEKIFNANDMAATAAFYSDDAEISGSDYVVTGRKNLDNYWLSLIWLMVKKQMTVVIKYSGIISPILNLKKLNDTIKV